MTHEIPEIQGAPGEVEGAGSKYEADIREWQKKRAERLQADDGWLTVAGLFWLKEGENTFGPGSQNDIVLPAASMPHAASGKASPATAGSFIKIGDAVELRVAPGIDITVDGEPVTGPMKLTSDAEGKPELLSLGDLRLFLIKRSKGYAIRMRDLNAPARKEFTGIETFPVDSTWRIDARFVPYDPPKPVEIPSIIGTVDTMVAPGYVEFTRDGRSYRLDPVLESADADELFFIFKDETSGTETYPPGRFLYTPLPVDGRVLLDFNRAYNPPCAFTAFATCPLPPEQNILKLRVAAGEKRYAGGEH